MRPPLVSIIIDNYNYARYLRAATDSALDQSYPNVEVVVVDDGSTDESREVIASYGSRIKTVFKTNGGQASAFNAGFACSSGEIVIFLDSDDLLQKTAVECAVSLFGPDVAKVHWPLQIIDSDGIATGKLRPSGPLAEGNLRERILRAGPTNAGSPPTSGNAWARRFLERVMPVPEDVPYYRTCGDEYLYTSAPVLGEIRAIQQPQGCYRIHGQNIYSARPFWDKMRFELAGYEDHCAAISRVFEREGIHADLAEWKRHSWFHRLERALADIERIIPNSDRFILVDDDTWGREQIFDVSRALPFLERSGEYWGPPTDDATAISELRRLRNQGAAFMVLAWPAFWWLDYYGGLTRELQSGFKRCPAAEDIIIYDLRRPLMEQSEPVLPYVIPS